MIGRRFFLIIAILSVCGFFSWILWSRYGAEQFVAPQRPESDIGTYLFFDEPKNGLIRVRNMKFGYEVTVPESREGSRFAHTLSFIYTLRRTPNPFTGSISINLIGFPADDPYAFISSLFTQPENLTRVTVNGATAYKTDGRFEGSGTIMYQTYFVIHPDGLIFAIRFETDDPIRDEAKYSAVIKSIRFTGTGKKLPSTVRLSGRVTNTTGNCMPSIGGSNSCRSSVYKTTVYAYQMVREPLGSGPNGSPVSRVKTDSSGKYSLDLPPGAYSIYAELNGKRVCQGGDGFGFACPVILYTIPEKMDIRLSSAVY